MIAAAAVAAAARHPALTTAEAALQVIPALLRAVTLNQVSCPHLDTLPSLPVNTIHLSSSLLRFKPYFSWMHTIHAHSVVLFFFSHLSGVWSVYLLDTQICFHGSGTHVYPNNTNSNNK